jgi:ribonuclease HI
MAKRLFLFTDGASRGNPGPAAAGALLKDEGGEILLKRGQFLGRTTNNEAEYRALILGLKLAKRLAPEVLVCLLDSKLVVSQVNGLYRVKQDHLAKLLLEVRQAEKAYEKVLYKLIPREKNRGADALANEVLDGARQL